MEICFISDTHCKFPALPDADLLIHCGDLTGSGGIQAFQDQAEWFHSQRQRYPLGMLYIPGNHDKGLDMQMIRGIHARWMKDPYHSYPPRLDENSPEFIRQILKGAGVTTLIDEAITIEGIKFFGSPWTPTFMDWAFMKNDPIDLALHWQKVIPDDVNVLITHGPPKFILDLCRNGHVGSEALVEIVRNLPQLKLHAFGHIHEGQGAQTMWDKLFLNASVLDGYYNGFNPIAVVDTDKWEVIQWFEDKSL